ncbi:MAG TPA: class I SAM-dependent methyltransferase [Candidatus Sulfotelmatobacter sp.]|nr:class I SAM-dependent methyltransferase [Candidatus Sulfotelmatobacter sp.]
MNTGDSHLPLLIRGCGPWVIRPRGARPATYAHAGVDAAARRLEFVHRLFESSSRRFLREHPPHHPVRALDLACGPGCTTALLHDVVRADLTIGLDILDDFIRHAQHRYGSATMKFIAHDVTRMPLPFAPADVIFCRFAMAHMSSAKEAVNLWASQLVSGGRLLIEEVDSISTSVPVFAEYLSLAEDVIAKNSNTARAADILTAPQCAQKVTLAVCRGADVSVPPHDAATIYLSSLTAGSSRLASVVGDDAVNRLRQELEQVHSGGAANGHITWRLQQLVFIKAE